MTAQRLTDHSITDNHFGQLGSDLRAAVCSEGPLLISGNRDAARLIARVVHDHSPRRRATQFISVNHQTILETLATIPTSTPSSSPRFADHADGWTLFIDDVDRLSPVAQEMLMLFLEATYPAGRPGISRDTCGGRVVAATSEDLTEHVTAGSFRSDLFYRLNVIHLAMPLVWKAGERQLHALLASLSA